MASIEERRTQVRDLLKRCYDEKLLRGGTERAKQIAEEAVQLATKPARLPSPWPELASYRLAHLLLRDSDRHSHLAAIDEHLCRAGGSIDGLQPPPLGALPHIYRLSVLHLMMGQATNSLQRDAIQQRMNEEFKVACAAIDKPSMLGSNQAGPIQHEVFNLLEFASYFLNQSYQQLPGRGFREELLPGIFGGHWILVGPDPEISSVRLSKEFAYAELASRAAACPNALLIHLPERGNEPSWRLATDHEWRSGVNEEWIVLLANLLKTPSMNSDELRRKVIGNDDNREARDRYRKLKSRANGAIIKLTGRAGKTICDGSDRLADDAVTIYGVVHRPTLNPPRRG